LTLIQALSRETVERFGQNDLKKDAFSQKLEIIANDLKAHCPDTEAHLRGYRVREEVV
jgi:hypothetical protein